MPKQIIAVDVDDVLVPTNTAMRLYVNKHFGANHTEEDYGVADEYIGYWERVWGVGHEEAEERYNSFIQSGVLLKTAPVEGAIEAISQLEERFDLVIISARHADQVEMTHDWLLKYFPSVFSDIRFISGWYQGRKISKAEVCAEIGADYLIDDNLEHCLEAQKTGVRSLLFGNHGWSKHSDADSLTRLNDWEEVKEYFEKANNRA